MAWTSPRTWVAGEVLTASLLNTHVRDNLKAIGDAWTAWTPTVTAETGTFTTVSGAGRYIAVGKLIIWSATITVTTAGTASGGINITAPVTARAAGDSCGQGKQASSAAGLVCVMDSTTLIRVSRFDDSTIASIATTNVVSGMYEAA